MRDTPDDARIDAAARAIGTMSDDGRGEVGGYRCKCGEWLAERITAARDMQRFHVADVWMKQRADSPSAGLPNKD